MSYILSLPDLSDRAGRLYWHRRTPSLHPALG